LAFGLATFLIVHAFDDRVLIGNSSDAALDFLMRLQADGATASPGPPIATVDIDEAAFIAMGRPTITPRDVLAKILARIAEAQPKLVILDIDLGWPDSPSNEKALSDVLLKFARTKGAPVLLVREPLPNVPTIAALFVRPTPYDSIVNLGGRVRWVSADFLQDSDDVVRRLRPWVAACQDTKPIVLPSAVLAAKIVSHEQGSIAALDGLDKALRSAAPVCSGRQAAIPADASAQAAQLLAQPSKYQAVLSKVLREPRILYRFSWVQGAAFELATNTAQSIVVPPGPVLDPDADLDIFRGRIVVVGSSAAEARDMHLTPLGEMPGEMILANAVRSMIGEGPVHESGFWNGLLIAALMSSATFGAWILFRRILDLHVVLFREGLKLVLTGMWAVLAWMFLSHGAAVDYAFPQYVVISYLVYAEGFRHAF
jgi:CHASE2 domain-containing sensor protein